jgi:hypothetical protein
MLIYADPTELSTTSALPKCMLELAKPLQGLEAYTSADILLSAEDIALERLDDSVLSKTKMARLLTRGILIQRKTGSDICNFITDHTIIAEKMHPWCKRFPPWLLAIGSFVCGQDGSLLVDGRKTHFQYTALLSALDNWQFQGLNGGFTGSGYTILARETLVKPWLNSWQARLESLPDTLTILPGKPSQALERLDSIQWRTTLMTFPGIGLETATAIAQYCGSLATSIEFLSNPDHIVLKRDADWPKGVGPSKFADAHKWLGLEIGDEEVEQMTTVMEPRLQKKRKHAE